MLQLMVKVIESLPSNQEEFLMLILVYLVLSTGIILEAIYNPNDSTSQSRSPTKCSYFLDWVKSVQNNQYSEFMDLWETCMNWSYLWNCRFYHQHGGKNCHLGPKHFSMELYLKFNSVPLHLLDSLIGEVHTREPVKFCEKRA